MNKRVSFFLLKLQSEVQIENAVMPNTRCRASLGNEHHTPFV
jgi:hypothetical protein